MVGLEKVSGDGDGDGDGGWEMGSGSGRCASPICPLRPYDGFQGLWVVLHSCCQTGL